MRYLLLLVLVAACAPPSNSVISGEIFVVTASRQSVKLAGSIIYVHPGIETAGYLSRSSESDTLKVLADIPSPVSQTVADSEGRFRISVPRGSYYLVVIEKRAIVGTTEFYAWLVPVDAMKDVSINLDNSNLISLTP
jgi:hypothetical protein